MAKYFRIPFATSGTKTAVPDASQPDGTVSYTDGYGEKYSLAITDPDALRTERDKMNELFFDVTDALKTIQSHGIADWISSSDNGGTAFSYDVNALVRYTDGGLYRSLTSTNTAIPTNPTYWADAFNYPVYTADGSITKLTPFFTFKDTGGSSINVKIGVYAGQFTMQQIDGSGAYLSNFLLADSGAETLNLKSSNSTLGGDIIIASPSGIVGTSQGGAGTVNGLLKANGSGVVSQAVAGTDYVVAGAAPANGVIVTENILVAVSDETTALTTGTNKITFRMPYAITLTSVKASVGTAPTGANLVVDINENGTTILSTKLSIDAGEKTSVTAATPPVISDTALAADAEITIDIDQIGSTIAGAGLKVCLIGHQ